MNDDQTQTVAPTQDAPQNPKAPTVELPIPPTDTTPLDMPSVASEAPRDALTPVPVEDQNGAVKQQNSQIPEPSFIRALLLKAQAKIQFNKQKKLNKLIQFAQRKGIVTNDDVQKLLLISDATATRYLVKFVQEGRLIRIDSPRDAKYQFVH